MTHLLNQNYAHNFVILSVLLFHGIHSLMTALLPHMVCLKTVLVINLRSSQTSLQL